MRNKLLLTLAMVGFSAAAFAQTTTPIDVDKGKQTQLEEKKARHEANVAKLKERKALHETHVAQIDEKKAAHAAKKAAHDERKAEKAEHAQEHKK